MNEMLTFLAAWLVDVLVLGTALLTVSALLLVMLRQPMARMAVARGTLLGLATLCVLTSLPCWPRQPLPEMFSVGSVQDEAAAPLPPLPDSGVVYAQPLVAEAPLSSADPSPPDSPAPQALSMTRLIQLLPLFWLGAAACAVAYLFLGAWRAFRLVRSAVKAPEWSQQELQRLVSPKNRAPRLKTSERIATAVALLAWRPHILLAAQSVCEENKAAVRAALAHEWAHIRHGDLWLLALERLLLPVFCLHPLFWLLRRQVRIDQELLADAAAAGEAPVEYAQALLSWAKAENTLAAPGFGIAALSLWEHPSSLSRRVEMLLNPEPSASAGVSRLWKWLAPLSLLSAVIGLSLVTLRPAAVAQDDTLTDVDAQPRPQKIKKAKKEKPKKVSAKHDDIAPDKSPPAASPTGAQVFLELLVGQVDHAALEKAESSLGDLIQAASEDHCRLEGNLIVAELSPKQYSTLTVELKRMASITVLSQPKLVTLDGQKATLQIGGEVPLIRLEETVNGDPRRRVEYREVGETIVICPYVSGKDPSRLTLDIDARHTELDRRAELRTGDDTPRFITNKFELEVEAVVGKTLVITEREPKKGSGRNTSILLAVVPLKILPAPPAPAPAASYKIANISSPPSGDLERLRDENAALHKQISALQARLIDLEAQVRWLRAAAAPGGEEKVSDQEFLRRVYLDLMGLLPTAEETKSFLNDKDTRKRDRLIDELLKGSATKKEASSGRIKWKDATSSDLETIPMAIKPAPQGSPPEQKDPDALHLFRLAHSQADAAAQVLAKVLPAAEGLAVAVDERTNSLILRGPPATMQQAKALLEVLDRKVDPKADPKEPARQENGHFQRVLKDADMRLAEAALHAAKAQYERTRILHKEKAIAEAELDQAAFQLKHAEIVVEAAKSDKDSVKLRELEFQEAEAAFRTAELSLSYSERLLAKGLLSHQQLEEVRFAVAQKKVIAEEAKARAEKAKAGSASKP
ncbi:MAG: M56 family metallopeptidase [Pirellulaceae bacterium]